jgi:non-ribosomal peptide synthetase component E (peptide arylation enzyme)
MEVMLVDDAGMPAEPGEVGEIVVKSRYLSLGYWRRPELTERTFRPDPRGGQGRLYATRDLGRVRPNGTLECLGRKDFRVKIRGFRVEVAEVEIALLALEGIKTAVAVGREVVPGDVRLVAYVVPAAGCKLTVGDLRRDLAVRLPDHMIPSRFVILESLPTLPGGKVDRQALPPPGRARPEMDRGFAPPRTCVEEALASIWMKVLDFDQVGVHDNFLEIGGNSLQAARIVARVLDTFNVDLPVQVLLQAGTIADMATLIVQSLARNLDPDDIERLLAEVESIAPDDVQRLLADQGRTSSGLVRLSGHPREGLLFQE